MCIVSPFCVNLRVIGIIHHITDATHCHVNSYDKCNFEVSQKRVSRSRFEATFNCEIKRSNSELQTTYPGAKVPDRSIIENWNEEERDRDVHRGSQIDGNA